MTTERDIVKIFYEDNFLAFARIEEIAPDVKKDWYLVKLLILQSPLQVVTWILRDEYINGVEFTMDGKRIRMVLVECPETPSLNKKIEDEETGERTATDGNVISLATRRKKEFRDASR